MAGPGQARPAFKAYKNITRNNKLSGKRNGNIRSLDGTERVERRSKDLKTRGICGEADPALGSGALDDILTYSRTEDI